MFRSCSPTQPTNLQLWVDWLSEDGGPDPSLPYNRLSLSITLARAVG